MSSSWQMSFDELGATKQTNHGRRALTAGNPGRRARQIPGSRASANGADAMARRAAARKQPPRKRQLGNGNGGPKYRNIGSKRSAVVGSSVGTRNDRSGRSRAEFARGDERPRRVNSPQMTDRTPDVVMPGALGAWRAPSGGAYAKLLQHHASVGRTRRSDVAALRTRMGQLDLHAARAYDQRRPSSSPPAARRRRPTPAQVAPLPARPGTASALPRRPTAAMRQSQFAALSNTTMGFTGSGARAAMRAPAAVGHGQQPTKHFRSAALDLEVRLAEELDRYRLGGVRSGTNPQRLALFAEAWEQTIHANPAFTSLMRSVKGEYAARISHLESRNSALISGAAPEPGDDGQGAPQADIDLTRENEDLRMEIERLHARIRTLETADAPMSDVRGTMGSLDMPPHMRDGDGTRILDEDDISLAGESSDEMDENGEMSGSGHRSRPQSASSVPIPALAFDSLRAQKEGDEEGDGFHQAFAAEAPNFSDSWREGMKKDRREGMDEGDDSVIASVSPWHQEGETPLPEETKMLSPETSSKQGA